MTTPTTTAIEKKETITDFLWQPENFLRFSRTLGDDAAKPFVQSAIIAVASSDDLMACTKRSILSATLRAASLKLSLDPAVKQAYLVARNLKNKKTGNYEKVAVFQPHFMGLHTLAIRTNKFWVINVAAIHKDWMVLYNPLTGLHAIEVPNYGRMKDGYIPYQKVSFDDTQGWLAYYKTTKGFEKTVYMSKEEIEDRAKHFAPEAYANPKSLWHHEIHKETMYKKAPLLELLRAADITGQATSDDLKQVLEDEPPIEGEEVPVGSVMNTIPMKESKEAKVAILTGDNPDPVKDSTWQDWESWNEKAKKFQVPVADVKRGATTDNDLRAYIIEVAPYIRDAESQAQAA